MTRENILENNLGPHYLGPGTTESVLAAMDEYYNQAIDEAIAICNKSTDHADLVDDRTSLNTLNEVISKLESLKKKP
jgi:hypothetical protein